ncbi:hypothetical protein X801_01965 [Opisthorchis viverrini]|uniref:Major facilitator superfamily (MFS) profile domain-containing protein n=1 Tax=Opisthorchis viverrini TaxID=6198 RepID=A0A1S8X6Q7_OPIVI|nr:hypothetical protein X801_01965 [Opisthorchis viverrini]
MNVLGEEMMEGQERVQCINRTEAVLQKLILLPLETMLHADCAHDKFTKLTAYLSIWYDVGGILGGIAAGLISDVANRHISRHTVSVFFSIAAIPALLAYRFTPGDPKDVNGLVMALAGFFVGGPAVLISAVIAGDIGQYAELRSSRTQATLHGRHFILSNSELD